MTKGFFMPTSVWTAPAALGDAARSFLASSAGMLIDGQFVPAASGATFTAEDPSTGEVIMRVPEAGVEDVDLAVRAARRAFEGAWAEVKPRDRGQLLLRLADLLEQHGEELAQLDALNNGKPLALARGDIALSVDHYRYMAGWATKITGEYLNLSAPGEYLAFTSREPVGVAAQIIPWNFPLVSIAWKLGPALAAGCTVVLKTAEQTPVSALRFAQLVVEAGFPAGVVNIITGFGDVAGAALVSHPEVDKIAFTGSNATGQAIARVAADGLKRLTLELGGKNPIIVLPDADLDRVVQRGAAGIFYNQGQVCTAATMMLVHEKIADRVIEGISDTASKITLAPGLDPSSEMGPLVSSAQLERVTGYVDAGVASGAEVVVGGKQYGDRGYFFQPTVLIDERPESRISREEIFGPVLVARTFSDEDLDQIVRDANSTQFGLAASIFTQNSSVALRLARRIKAGTVWINTHNVFDSSMPLGGYKMSGYGRELGSDAIRSYTETKSIAAEL